MWAWYATNSSAIMSDALESLINVATAFMAIFAVYVSSRPADETHPYGHGKVEFFSSGVEGALIILAGLAILSYSIDALIFGAELSRMDFGLLLVGIAGVINFILGLFLVQSGKKHHSEALIANGHHVLSDAWTSLGIIVGISLVIVTEIPWIDPLIAGFVGIWILVSGYKIIRKSVGRLMDEADPQLLARIAKVLSSERRDSWIIPHRLRAWRSGATVRIDFHLIMPTYWTLEQTHEQEHAIHDSIKAGLDEPCEIIVHTEPCFSACCRICSMSDCPIRVKPIEERLPWTSNLLGSELIAQTNGHTHPDMSHKTHEERDSI
jgi:cation diffusion facilitator family transporter